MSVRGSTDLLLYMSILPLSCHVILAMHVMSLQNVGGHKQKIYHRVSLASLVCSTTRLPHIFTINKVTASTHKLAASGLSGFFISIL